MIREAVAVATVPGAVVSLERPDSWLVERGETTPAFLALQPENEAGPFRDNLLVAIEKPATEQPLDLETAQSMSRAQALATVPDYHLIDDRPLEVGGVDGWFRAAVYSSESMTTVTVRQLFAVHGGVLVTITLTSFPFRDPESSELFERVAATCSITTEGAEA